MFLKCLLFVVVCLGSFQNSKCQCLLWSIPSNDGVGFINIHGEVVMNTRYNYVGDFSEGLANFEDSLLSGYIDSTGKVVFSGNDYFYDFKDGLSYHFVNGSLVYVNNKGEMVLTPRYKGYLLGCDNFYCKPSNFSEGLAPVLIKNNKSDDLYIYINKKGELAFKGEFKYADYFSEGFAFVVLQNNIVGYVNKHGEMVVELQKGAVGSVFSEGFAVVSDSLGNDYYINKTGEILWGKLFSNAYSFSDGLARVNVDGKYGYVNKKGELVVNPVYNSASTYDFSEGLASVSIDNPNGTGFVTYLIDTSGVVVSKPFYNSIIRRFKNGLAYGTQATDRFKCDVHFYINKKFEVVWKDTICVP